MPALDGWVVTFQEILGIIFIYTGLSEADTVQNLVRFIQKAHRFS